MAHDIARNNLWLKRVALILAGYALVYAIAQVIA